MPGGEDTGPRKGWDSGVSPDSPRSGHRQMENPKDAPPSSPARTEDRGACHRAALGEKGCNGAGSAAQRGELDMSPAACPETQSSPTPGGCWEHPPGAEGG